LVSKHSSEAEVYGSEYFDIIVVNNVHSIEYDIRTDEESNRIYVEVVAG